MNGLSVRPIQAGYPDAPRVRLGHTRTMPLCARAFVPLRRADMRSADLSIPLAEAPLDTMAPGGGTLSVALDARGRWLEIVLPGEPGALRVDTQELVAALAAAAVSARRTGDAT